MDILRSGRCLMRRSPHYGGWWTLILQTRKEHANNTNPHATADAVVKVIAEGDAMKLEEPASVLPLPPPNNIVILNGQSIQLPSKPDLPDNCCMSGCAHCVWDIYQEDMEEYLARRKKIRHQFLVAGCAVPDILGPSKGKSEEQQAQDDMDPAMRAFLSMEAKLRSS